jgi:hypothetical protein
MTASMTPAAPNIAGFIEAAVRLRREAGTDVAFKVPVTDIWPEGTKVNPDTGQPFDPTIKPTSDPFTVITKRALIIAKQGSPLRPQSDTYWEQAGMLTGMDIILDVGAEDFAEIEDASEMTVNTLNYKIEEAKPFAVDGTIYRWLVYGRER